MLHLQTFATNPLQENTYLLYNDDGDAAIIDPGFYTPAERAYFDQFIATNRLTPRHLLLTHAHFDHVFGLKQTAATYQLVPTLHPNDEQMLKFAPMVAAQMWQLPFEGYEGPLQFINHHHNILLGAHSLQVRYAPGHSPGHVVFYHHNPASDAPPFAIVGDTLFAGSIGRTDLPGCHHPTLLQSIQNELLTLPNPTQVYPGHGPATTIGTERVGNPYLQNMG
jgi:hydroxyacylglutathione hydrolase